ncbi:MAG: ATP-dependent zinc metalloprotease FtsH [Caldilineaceae bacterium SB0661_bin_32]|uniref:ATP-dependent zinc metalloprotease FtsH n=1 Tax=Caldilineaceae bacterium SB0661_bin_32 TaxID=2605255 RepID=A0A6B1DB68_9CHLR|nr:ATP-dependent zinc metalloprotease FtsH [Caldilineaceae bacterium SB0661_bin_32]
MNREKRPDGERPPEEDPNERYRQLFKRSWIWILLAVLIFFAYRLFINPPSSASNLLGLNEVAEYVRNGSVQRIVVQGDDIIVEISDSERRRSRKESGESLLDSLKTFGVTADQLAAIPIDVERAPNSGAFFNWLIMLLPMILIFGFFIFIMRQAGAGGQNRAMQFGRSRAKKMEEADRPTVTFEDVAGSDEAKQELQEVVEFLKEPEKFAALGARIPKGVLMVGSPGTGKTLLAKAVAGEAGAPFFSISGSEFVEMFVGVGASRVRDLFEQAKKSAPCIIFIDEIDAVGRHRGAGMGGGNDEREQTLNQILVEMDGFDSDTTVIVIAATNRPDILDPALLRPGRFDRKVVVDWPDQRGREAILQVHARGKPLGPDVDLEEIARRTPGMVGANLENLLNEAAILTARRNKRAIGMDELVESIERAIAGPARKGNVLSEEERRMIAYHEAGHAVVFEILEHAAPVRRISIVSRGPYGGYVMSLPEDERRNKSLAEYEDELAGALGGRVAEELIFKEITTGAVSDLKQVTKDAKDMVTRYGMSRELGPMQLVQGDSNPFLGMELGERRTYSENVARAIDREMRRIVDNAYSRAKEVLTTHQDKLHRVAEALLEREVLEREEFKKLIFSS